MATLLREGSFSVFFLMVTPVLKAYLQQYTEHETSSGLMAGFASGVGATLMTQPLDTVKTIQQASASPLGFFKTAQGIGLGHLFKGTLSRGSSVVLSITLMSMLKEQLEDSCKEYNYSRSKLF
jgi:solute carrier family 25 citrate transporter 1